MRERLKQWLYWFTMPWTFRHLPQCYRNALTGLACCFDGEAPPPEGKAWECKLWIDHDVMGLGMAHLIDTDASEGKEPEMEWVAEPTTTGTCTGAAVWQSQTYVLRPKRLGGFQS